MQIVLLIVGFINALYLLQLHLTRSMTCGLGDGCQTVLNSSYAAVFNFPIAAIGVSAYLFLLGLQLLYKTRQISDSMAASVGLLVLTPATALGIVLMGVQLFQIGAFCPFCTLNSMVFLILFILAYREYLQTRAFNIQLNAFQWVGLVALAVIPLVFARPLGASSSGTGHRIGRIAGETVSSYRIATSSFGAEWKQLKQKEYQIKKQFFDMTLLELHAKKQNQSVKSYVDTTILPTIQISDNDIRAFYEKKKHDIPKDKTYDDVKDSIRRYLVRQKEYTLVNDHIQSLYPQYNAFFMAQPPNPTKINPNSQRVYSLGNKNAPIHIIEFSDLECGHCQHAFVEIKDLVDQFKDTVYFEYRHYPLPGHVFAKSFSVASVCAGEQDRFLDYVGLVFENQRRLPQITPESLAKTLGLDVPTFKACLTDPFALGVVEEDMAEANRLNVQSTPTFYINGQIFSGIPTAADISSFL